MVWFDNTDIKRIRLLLDEAKQKKETILRRVVEGETELDVLQIKYNEIMSLIRTALNPFNWFDSEQKNLKARLNVIKKELHLKQNYIDGERKLLSEIKSSISDKDKELEKYKLFNRQQAANDLSAVTNKIDEHENELIQVSKRKDKVDIELFPIIDQISRYKSDIEKAKDNIRRAQSMNQRLERAGNSYERAMVHRECESLFGDGSPSNVIRKQENLVRQYEKDLDKTRKRAAQVGNKAARDIKRIVIDGNNLCYERNKFVGLAPLITLTKWLHQEEYKVIVVFDSAIRSQLKSNDKDIGAQFEDGVNVHIVASKQLADGTILDIASNDKFCYVISNDRYGEYKEKEAVVYSRIIQHEIVEKRIMIHDLGFSQSYG